MHPTCDKNAYEGEYDDVSYSILVEYFFVISLFGMIQTRLGWDMPRS